LTGNANATTRTRSGWFAHLRQMPHHYFAIDGGSGAHLLAALAERHRYVRQAASPRHADLLLVVEPIGQKLAPVVVEVAKALPRPAYALLVGEPETDISHVSDSEFARIEALLPGARRISQASVEAILDAVLQPQQWSELALIDAPGLEPTTIRLPQKQEQEMATEPVVLSLGPIQPFTVGPLRLLLICDGEQVLSAQVEAGYAYRGIGQAMTQADWQQALHLARHLDPLAPIASQLAYVRAVEHLQGWQPPAQVMSLREAALALERVQNYLWWLVRFVRILADTQLVERSYHLATEGAASTSQLWQQPPTAWLVPQQQVSTPLVERTAPVISRLQQVADGVAALSRDVERNRSLALRTRGIGVLRMECLKAAGVSGSVLWASERGAGDVQSRVNARLQAAATDVCEAIRALGAVTLLPPHTALWDIPTGEASVTVKGPRGDIGLRVVSQGGEKPTRVEWQRPSAALLPLLPELLVDQKLADAEVIIASLDLAMAEAEG
jgi:NADH-quinone oxidoreductase subunit D